MGGRGENAVPEPNGGREHTNAYPERRRGRGKGAGEAHSDVQGRQQFGGEPRLVYWFTVAMHSGIDPTLGPRRDVSWLLKMWPVCIYLPVNTLGLVVTYDVIFFYSNIVFTLTGASWAVCFCGLGMQIIDSNGSTVE